MSEQAYRLRTERSGNHKRMTERVWGVVVAMVFAVATQADLMLACVVFAVGILIGYASVSAADHVTARKPRGPQRR